MIDPQGQAVSWIRSKESSNLPAFGTAALNDPKLRDKLEFTMSDGKALIILGEAFFCVADHRAWCASLSNPLLCTSSSLCSCINV